MRMTGLLAAALVAAAAGSAASQDAQAEAPPAREILFGFDRTPFGADGIETTASAARAFLFSGAGAADVAGHADTKGNPAYNRALSLARADFTRDELVARGVPARAVATRALGETDLAEATGDDVRRAANRRVTIALIGAGTNPIPDETRPYSFALPRTPAIRD